MADERDDEPLCRICRCDGSDEQPLFHPCKCKGSIRFIHEKCCLQWLQHSGQRQACELCHAPLRFEPIYAADTPDQLSPLQFAFGLARRSSQSLLLLLRVAVCLALWFVALPFLLALCFNWWVSDLDAPPLHMLGYGAALIVFCIANGFLMFSFGDLVLHFVREAQLAEPPLAEPPADAAAAAAAPPVAAEPPAPDAGEQLPPLEPVPDDGVDLDEDDAEGAVEAPAPQPAAAAAAPPAVAAAAAPQAAPAAAAAARDDVGVAVVPQNDLVARLAVDDDERMLFRELDCAIGMHGLGKAVLRIAFVGTICMTVMTYALALPAWLGRSLLETLGDEEAVAERPLWYVLLVGYGSAIGTAVLACAVVVVGDALTQRETWSHSRRALATEVVNYAWALLTSLKVALVMLFELVVFPLSFAVAGEVALLPLTDGEWSERVELHLQWLWVSIVAHWLVGLAFMYGFAVAIAWLRHNVRAGLLWFIRDPEDPGFDPVHEIAVRSLARHTRRLILSFVIYLLVVASLVALPVAIWRRLGMLPVVFSHDNGELLLSTGEYVMMINIFLPPVVRLYRVSVVARRAFMASLRVCGIALRLDSFFFGLADNEPADGPDVVYNEPQADGDDGDDDEGGEEDGDAEDDGGDPPGNDFYDGPVVRQAPYRRPAWFALRVSAAVFFLWMSVVAFVVVVFGAPLALGRAMHAPLLNATPVPLLPSDLHRFFFGALLLGLAFRVARRLVAAVVAVREATLADLLRLLRVPPAANDAAAAAGAAAAGGAAAAPGGAVAAAAAAGDARRRGNAALLWTLLSKGAAVLVAVTVVRPILLGVAVRAVVVDVLLSNSTNLLTVVDDWLFGIMLDTALQTFAMMRRNDTVWRLPGEQALPAPLGLAARLERYELALLARDTFELALFVLTCKAAGVAAAFSAGEFGAGEIARVRAARVATASLPLARCGAWLLDANSAWIRNMHQSIRDEMFRVGVKLRNHDDEPPAAAA